MGLTDHPCAVAGLSRRSQGVLNVEEVLIRSVRIGNSISKPNATSLSHFAIELAVIYAALKRGQQI